MTNSANSSAIQSAMDAAVRLNLDRADDRLRHRICYEEIAKLRNGGL